MVDRLAPAVDAAPRDGAGRLTLDMPLGPLMLDIEGDLCLSTKDTERLQHPTVGGVILFARNYHSKQQLRELTARLHSIRRPPLLIAVDQEGGRVQRFRDGFTSLPCAAEYGALYDRDPEAGLALARRMGRVMAEELQGVGVDFSFAPVLDVALTASDVIGDRAFHRDPYSVARLAMAFVGGMHQAGMAAVGKHFPGHGGVPGDSHVCLPSDPRRFDELEACDLVPYRALIKALTGVMTAHVYFDAVDGHTPAYSQFWLRQVLRKKLGFEGVVFSDDLSMRGARHKGDLCGRTRAALGAGCDMVLICNDLNNADRVLSQPPLTLDQTARDRLAKMRGVLG